MRNGKTVEVLNTDAEGRLILADALVARDARTSPTRSIDLATLTGACVVALGEKIAGLMGNDDAWIDAGAAPRPTAPASAVWPLPLPDDYRKLLDSEVADIKNIGPAATAARSPPGCSCRSSSTTCRGSHLDIAGPARVGGDDGYLPKGGTGFGVRTLLELASTFAPPAALAKQ